MAARPRDRARRRRAAGRRPRSVTAHLKSHGWTKDLYCQAFGLERGQSLEGAETRKLRAGGLTRGAAAAARGRPMPEQHCRKAVRALAAIPSAAVARPNSDRADRHLAQVAAAAAERLGYPDIRSFVLARVADGASLAAASREAGMHKDWLSRHPGRINPAAAARRQRPDARDAGWLPALRRLGFPDVAGYLREHHEIQHRTVNAIAAQIGVSHHAVEAALRRHQLARTPHATRRNAARQRAAEVAERLGSDSIADYVARRRSAGWTWQAIADESGQPQSWLRRHAAPPL
jgi:hypothetical protein